MTIPAKLTGELACILEDCGPPDRQSPEALAELIRHYQPTWDRIAAALAATPALDIPLHKAIERIIEDHVRDFHGLRNAVTNTSDGMISVNRETDFQVSPIKSDGETKA